jgi:hypothetical protein
MRMRFFFPDSQDLVDPSFDFEAETRAETRVPQRDDHYAHEVFSTSPYDGILVSLAIVEGTEKKSKKFTDGQRQRLYREGVRRFFRLDRPGARSLIQTMGDCGAFASQDEEEPPFSVDQVIDFYEGCGFDLGVSVDLMIGRYDAGLDEVFADLDAVSQRILRRQQITLQLAQDFLKRHEVRRCRFVPIGVAQGWSPNSYAESVTALQKMGYRRIAVGGLVPLKTHDIRAVVAAVGQVRDPEVQFHLLGITRVDHLDEFSQFGVTSFDTTSPLRQAFKDGKDNYHTPARTYTAIRVPQVDGPVMRPLINSGAVAQHLVLRLEQRCLQALREFDRGETTVESTLEAIEEYEQLYASKGSRVSVYREALQDAPWKQCGCEICRRIGIDVILFRGAERNRRRGFHNVYVLHQKLQDQAYADMNAA